MEKDKEFELIVHEGNRPLWQTVIASLIFMVMFFFIFQMGQLFYYFGASDITLQNLPRLVYGITYCMVLGLGFSVVKSVLIDVDTDKLVTRFSIGMFSYDKSSPVPELEYVSVFKDGTYNYQVNLWYIGNKHYVMCDFDHSEPAFLFGHYVASKLKLDMLDATVKGDFKWVEVKKTDVL